MSDDKNITGDIERRICQLEDLVSTGRHDRFFREFVQFAKEFARVNDRAKSIATSGEYADLQKKEFELSGDKFSEQRRRLASQGLIIVFDIAEDPRDPEPEGRVA